MSIRGRWRVVDTPGYDMAVAGAYILFDEGSGEFAFGCLTGSIHGGCDGDAAEFDGRETTKWSRPTATAGPNCRMTALEGEICLLNGDDVPFVARRLETSSTAC